MVTAPRRPGTLPSAGSRLRGVAGLLSGALLVTGLAACASAGGKGAQGTSHSTTTRAPAPTTSSTAASTTSSMAPTASTSTSTSTAAPPAGFTAAKGEWEQGASASSTVQGGYWTSAANDLTGAIASGGPHAGYQTTVGELQQLASLPETDDTPAQMAEAQNDTTALNTFFGTPGLYD